MATLSMGGADFTCASGNWTDAPSGTVVQVQSAYVNGSTTQVTSSGSTFSELDTDLRVAFTPRIATSKLYFEFYGWFCCPDSTNLHYARFYDVTNSSVPGETVASGSRKQVHWAVRVSDFDVNDFAQCNMQIAVTNTNTTARTYTIQWATEGVTDQFLESTLSTASGVSAPLFFKIMEVAP